MTNGRDDPLDQLTFSQRYGYDPIPEPMRLEEISADLRRELWNTVRDLLLSIRSLGGHYFEGQAGRFIERVVGKYEKIPESEVSTDYLNVMKKFEEACLYLNFNKLLEVLEAIINDVEIDDEFSKRIKRLFELHGASYWLEPAGDFFATSTFPAPVSKEQGDLLATRQAIALLMRPRRPLAHRV